LLYRSEVLALSCLSSWDINYIFAIVLIYLFIIYTTFGGLYSVSKSHRLNFMLVVLGVALAAFVVLKEAGGIYSIYENSMMINTRPFPGFLHVTEEGGMVHLSAKGQMPPLLLFTSFFGWGLGLSSTPQYAIRIVAAKDDITAKKMIFYSLIALLLLYTVLVIIIGMGGRTVIPSIDNIRSVDEVFPYLINNVLYSPLSGLIFIGIIAASISSADSQLLIASSGFTYDIYKNLINNSIDDDRFLNLNRAFIFAVGTAALLLAIKPPDSLLIYGGYIWFFFFNISYSAVWRAVLEEVGKGSCSGVVCCRHARFWCRDAQRRERHDTSIISRCYCLSNNLFFCQRCS